MRFKALKCSLILTLVVGNGCQVKDYYSFNSDRIFTIEEVQDGFTQVAIGLPPELVLEPIIYHKDTVNDSIINFIEFSVKQKRTPNDSSVFNPKYTQDSLFLLLNKKMPDFTLKDLHGQTFQSSSMFGKPWLANFWAIYCSPCIKEIPELNKLRSEFGDKVGFVAVTENTCEEDELAIFLENHPFNFLILKNGEALKKELRISALPKTFFIDHEGIIQHIASNYPISTDQSGKGLEESLDNYFLKWVEELVAKYKEENQDESQLQQ